MDAGLAAALGAIGGASATGLFTWLKSIVDNRAKQREADAQRKHEVDLANANRGHDQWMRDRQREDYRRADMRAEHAKQIREWRDGLAASHREYEEWAAKRRATEGRPASMGRLAEPNIVSAVWFQSLRPYLSDSVEAAQFRTGDDIQCDSDVAEVLGEEISRMEQEWRHEDG